MVVYMKELYKQTKQVVTKIEKYTLLIVNKVIHEQNNYV